MQVILEVEKGPNSGTRYELPLNQYRAVGRAGHAEVTMQFDENGDRALDPDDLRHVEEHLRRRAPAQDEAPLGVRIGAFRRGRDILLDDVKISRTHAMFFLDDAGASVVDLLSTNGTLVNGRRTGDADLRDGDIVNLGKTRIVVHIEA